MIKIRKKKTFSKKWYKPRGITQVLSIEVVCMCVEYLYMTKSGIPGAENDRAREVRARCMPSY